jgi:NitT/TauT family transport system substrate-binding protein
MGVSRRQIMLRLAALLVALLTMPDPASSQTPPVTVRFGSVGGMSDAGLYLADEFGYFREAGLRLDMQRQDSAPTLTAAIAMGELDVAGIALSPALFNSVTRGLALRIVGDKQTVGNGFSATRLVVVGPGALATLKGKTVGVSSLKAIALMQLRDALATAGLSLADVHVTELPYPNMVTAMATGALDGAVIQEPFLTRAINVDHVHVVSDLIPPEHPAGYSTVALVYSEKFRERRATAQAFMDAYVRGVRAYVDAFAHGVNKARIIDIIAQRAKLPADMVRDSFPPGLDPNQLIDAQSLNHVQEFFVQQGDMTARVTLDQVTDPSFAQASVAKLGVYQADHAGEAAR